MRNLCALYFLLTLAFSLTAGSENLTKAKIIADAYYKLGDDNNYLDFSLITTTEFASHKEQATEVSDARLVASIKKCVFMQKGAYGNHLGKKRQYRLSYEFSLALASYKTYELASNSFAIGTGTFNAPCILAIEDLGTGEVLLMQAAAID